MSTESLKQFDNIMNAVRKYEQYVKSVKVKKTTYDPNHEPSWLNKIKDVLDSYNSQLTHAIEENANKEFINKLQKIVDDWNIKYKAGKKSYKKWLIEHINKEEEYNED